MAGKDDEHPFQEASSGLTDLECNLQMAEQKLGLPDWNNPEPLAPARLLRVGVPPELVGIIEEHMRAITGAILRGDEPPRETSEAEAAREQIIAFVARKALS